VFDNGITKTYTSIYRMHFPLEKQSYVRQNTKHVIIESEDTKDRQIFLFSRRLTLSLSADDDENDDLFCSSVSPNSERENPHYSYRLKNVEF
jgi:hypothetical protein